jgi:hypothetical protein
MTDQSSPITPSPELRAQWRTEAPIYRDFGVGREEWLIDRAAQWGWDQRGTINEAMLQERADQELEACCEWAKQFNYDDEYYQDKLRAARRPKPPSLKECALNALEHILRHSQTDHGANTIRHALEQLND